MARVDGQSGFSLTELVIVMAITSMLAVIAFAGQRSLRSRAQFDAAVDKIVSTVADAHSQAVAGVNIVGAGDGSSSCLGGPAGQYVFAGVAWTADNTLPGGPIKFDYYKAIPGAFACVFQTQAVSLPSAVAVSVGVQPGARVLMVRNDSGGLAVCPWTNLAAGTELATFQAGACATGSVTFRFSDADGHVSQVLVDQSGLARRLN